MKHMVCSSRVVVQLEPSKLPGGNTPGANLLQLLSVRRAVRTVQSVLRSAVVVPRVRSAVFYVGEVFAEVLFGLSMYSTCVEELESTCPIQRYPRENSAAATLTLGTLGGKRQASALRAARPRVIKLLHSNAKRNITHVSDKMPDPSDHDDGLHFLRAQYRLMRTLVPLELPAFLSSGFNIVAHIRGGGGARSFHESLYLPILEFIGSILKQRGVPFRVHVYHELARSKVCCLMLEQGRGGRVFVHTDPNRITMFHAFMMADVLIMSDSLLPSLAARLNSRGTIAFDPRAPIERDSVALVRSRLVAAVPVLNWVPCKEHFFKTGDQSVGIIPCTPCVGANESLIRHLLARVGGPERA
jgi:hypothetical protein